MMGENSVLTKRLGKLEKLVAIEGAMFRTKMRADSSFPTKFLYAVDNKIQRWLGQCTQAMQRDEVNDRLVNFENLVDSVLDGYFNADLPAVFKVPPRTEAIASPPTKRPRLNSHGATGGNAPPTEEERTVINKNQHPDFKMRSKESWRKTFCGVCVDERPMWSENYKMCPRFHIKGDFFKDCRWVDSHKNKDKISTSQKEGMLAFLKSVRDE